MNITANRHRVLIPGYPAIKCDGVDARRLADEHGGQAQEATVTVRPDQSEILGPWHPVAAPPAPPWDRELAEQRWRDQQTGTPPPPPPPAVPLTVLELLRVATGRPITMTDTTGRGVVVRLATVDEILDGNEHARNTLIAAGGHPSEATAITPAQAEKLARPLHYVGDPRSPAWGAWSAGVPDGR